MNKKLTILDIADLVSSKSGITKKEAEIFVKEFFSLASEVISSGESLTIKGVGVFVPVWVEARTSVDVNTKQPIEIPGHYKLSYTPDKSMRDAVNAPFAAFTTEVVELEMPEMVEIKEQEIEKNNIDTASVEEPIENEVTLEVKEEEPIEMNIEIEQFEEVHPENVEEVEEEQSNSETPIIDTDAENESEITVVSALTVLRDEEEIQKEYRRRTRNGYISGFLTAVVLFIIFISAWFFLFKGGEGISLSFSSFKVSSVREQPEEDKSEDIVINTQENNVDSIFVESKETENVIAESAEVKTQINEVVTEIKEPVIETIQRGKFLTTIAEKHYGDKAFWVYIYRENSGRIWNPRDLKAGFKVVVPDAAKYGIDASDPESVNKAKELEKQILYEIE